MEPDDRARPDPEASGLRPGNRGDFDRLYATAYPRVFRTLAAVLGDPAAAEDCTQAAFLQAFKAWPRWKQDAPIEAWVHGLAIGTATSYRRKHRVGDVGGVPWKLGLSPKPDRSTVAFEGSLVHELHRLPLRQAVTLVLRHLHGYSDHEIAAALGVPEVTITPQLTAARRSLRKRLPTSSATIPEIPESLRVCTCDE